MAYQEPNKDGFYGKFGGRFVPETLMTAVLELEKAYRESQADPSFQEELTQLLRQYVGRETPLYYAKNLTQHIGGAKIYLNGKTLTIQGPTRLTMPWDKFFWLNAWAKRKLSLKQVLVSTVWQLQLLQPSLTWNVLSTWVRKMSNAKPSMSSVWSFWELRLRQ